MPGRRNDLAILAGFYEAGEAGEVGKAGIGGSVARPAALVITPIKVVSGSINVVRVRNNVVSLPIIVVTSLIIVVSGLVNVVRSPINVVTCLINIVTLAITVVSLAINVVQRLNKRAERPTIARKWGGRADNTLRTWWNGLRSDRGSRLMGLCEPMRTSAGFTCIRIAVD